MNNLFKKMRLQFAKEGKRERFDVKTSLENIDLIP